MFFSAYELAAGFTGSVVLEQDSIGVSNILKNFTSIFFLSALAAKNYGCYNIFSYSIVRIRRIRYALIHMFAGISRPVYSPSLGPDASLTRCRLVFKYDREFGK